MCTSVPNISMHWLINGNSQGDDNPIRRLNVDDATLVENLTRFRGYLHESYSSLAQIASPSVIIFPITFEFIWQ